MSDLSSLMQIAPGSAAYMMGQNQAQARETEALRQQELQAIIAARLQENQHSADMNPLRVDNQRLTNRTAEARLPGITAESTLAQATLPGNIAATDAVNQGKVRDNKIKTAEGINNFFIDTGAALDGVPPALRMRTLVDRMSEYGINPQAPLAQDMLNKISRMDANDIPKYFRNLAIQTGQAKANRDPGHMGTMNVHKLDNDSRERIAAGHDKASMYNADKAAEARKAAAAARAKGAEDVFAGVRSGKVPPEKAQVQFEYLSMTEDDPVKKEQYANFAKLMEQLVLNKPVAGKAGDTTYNAETGQIENKQRPAGVLGNQGKPQLGTKENPIKLD